MRSYLSTLLALGTLSTSAAAVNIVTYTNPGCNGCGIYFKDIAPQMCALSITVHANITVKQAIAAGLTTVQSGKLQVWRPENKHFVAWDEGPDSNTDGPLQCGTVGADCPVTEHETCISQESHGFCWYETTDNAQKRDTPKCIGIKGPSGVVLDGTLYITDGIPSADAAKLMNLAYNNDGNVPDDLKQYKAA